MSDPVVPPAAPASTTEDRTAAILTYITIVGFIIAIVMPPIMPPPRVTS